MPAHAHDRLRTGKGDRQQREEAVSRSEQTRYINGEESQDSEADQLRRETAIPYNATRGSRQEDLVGGS